MLFLVVFDFNLLEGRVVKNRVPAFLITFLLFEIWPMLPSSVNTKRRPSKPIFIPAES